MAETTHDRFRRLHLHLDGLGLSLDVSRIHLTDELVKTMSPRLRSALRAMKELEAGALANPDEKRQVGHFWLRAPERAPNEKQGEAIRAMHAQIESFAAAIHGGHVRPARTSRFTDVLIVGIGGSALGPQFASAALSSPTDRMGLHFFDNTDPDGIDAVLDRLGDRLASTLAVVISKSGGTKETRNGMLELERAYQRLGLELGAHAVAVTGEGSELDLYATERAFLARFPMWDWVGGRTSQTSAVGLLPMALQGHDWRGLLEGAAEMDVETRRADPLRNAAALLALAWWSATGGQGRKAMVVLPYKDRLALFSRYLQQLVMESLGKRHDLKGNEVFQGIAVYGNKGSTDQHAYVQQLRDGQNDFFATFIEVLEDRHLARGRFEVEPGITSGDFLEGFLLGTRKALTDAGRESITLTVPRVDARQVGALIALYERAVALYAQLAGINAFHQPGVEAGKKAAGEVLAAQAALFQALADSKRALTYRQAAKHAGLEDAEVAFWLLRHAAANPHTGVIRSLAEGGNPLDATYKLKR